MYETSFHVGKIIYKTNKLKQEKEEKAEDLIKRAIYQQFTSEKDLRREAEKINTVLPSMFSVVILHAANGDGEAVEDLKENIRSYLNLRDKVSHVLTIESNIVIVVASFSQKSSVSSAASEFINKLLTHFHFQKYLPLFISVSETNIITFSSLARATQKHSKSSKPQKSPAIRKTFHMNMPNSAFIAI